MLKNKMRALSQFVRNAGEAGATLTKAVMISIANKILIRLSASTAGKAVPFLGAFVGGSVNYGFIRAMGAAVKKIDMSSIAFEENAQQNNSNYQLPPATTS
ncbi:MAG: hypothetical protein F6K16_25410 [Symploca sp. SIO2B6]|nr:hypothetical protein [Symploca sp. SIO2B6]